MPVVDPRDADVALSASTVAWRSNDGGRTWVAPKGAPGGDDFTNRLADLNTQLAAAGITGVQPLGR